MSTIGLLHPGRMGAAIGALLTERGHRVLWCPDGRSPGTAERAEQAGLTPAGLAELLAESAVVFSICPPAAAGELAEQVAGIGCAGVFVEFNAINPDRVTEIGRLLGPSVVDGAIIGGPPRGGSTVRCYLSGPPDAVRTVLDLLTGTAAEPVDLGEQLGRASALKMAFGSFQKISRALAAVSHALADQHDVTGHLLVEARRLGANALADPAELPAVAARAWRWGPEMTEAADTLRSHGLPPELAEAATEVLARWSADRDDFDLDLPTALAHLRTDS
jgi:3-hydroxyisobutyrate dehydrogenase-like beta-hydroxyacid dehydrogenase